MDKKTKRKPTGAAAMGAGPGRPPGSINKHTKAIKDAIVEAFDKAGGVDYLLQVSKDDPRTFLGLVGKVVPMQVDAGGKVVVEVVARANKPSS
jgi:hypothetical protein